MIRGNQNDIEAGSSNTKLETRCSKFIVKFTWIFLIMVIFMGYCMAISINSNIFGNIHHFDTMKVTDPPLNGNFYC